MAKWWGSSLPWVLPMVGAAGLLVAQGSNSLSSVEERFLELVAREWRWRLEEFPLLATRVGVREFDDRLAEESIEAYARRAEATRHFLEVLQGIPKEELPKSRQVDYDMFREQLEDRLAAYRFGEHFMPLNSDSGFHTEYALLPKAVYLETAQDYENYLARMRQVPKRLQENLSLLSRGLELGLTPPKVTLQGIESTLQRLVSEDPEAHPLFEPFQSLPTRFPPEKREEWRSEARKLLTAEIIPSYRKVASFLLETYLPRCRDTLSVQSLPQGSDYYRFLIRRFTTLPLEAREIHELGQREVAAIRAAMDGVRKEVGFTGTHEAFLEFLRNDPQFYARSPEELLTRARSIAKKMDAKLPALFRRLPRQPYGVMAVPDSLAPKYTAGRYSPSPRESTEPGWYWVNTYALEKRPLYNLVALTLHEAVPGHHLQHALAEEAEGILPFRRYTYLSAFGEGWGLYAEWLGLEAGLYETPYERFGLLGYQAWRAARLVVDTGIHAFGWTRDQAIAYLAENTTLPLHEVETEVDRYISWPGQALSYYIGYLEIRKLREKAEQTLGERFDVRAFHDLVLEEGSVPLPVLRQRVEQWLATQRGNF